MSYIDNVSQIVRDQRAFTVTTDLVTVDSNSEKDFLLLKNPSDSNVQILITHFKFGTDSSSVRSLIYIYANPTITSNGTALTIANTYIASSTVSSDMEAYKLPTISARGTMLDLDINPSNATSKGLNRWYWIEPGNSILTTVDNSVSDAKTFVTIYWLEGI